MNKGEHTKPQTSVVVPDMKELSHVQEYYSGLLLRKKIKIQASRSSFCNKRRDKGDIELFGLSVTTVAAIKCMTRNIGSGSKASATMPVA